MDACYFFNYSLNFPNGKRYIGFTNDPGRRFMEHMGIGGFKCYRGSHIVRHAVKKYGIMNIGFEILAAFDSKEEALKNEIKLIAEYKTMDREFGYNLTVGGTTWPEGKNGRYWMVGKTLEQIKEINRKKTGRSFYGKKHKKESMEKMVATRKANGTYDESPSSIIIEMNDGTKFSNRNEAMKFLKVGRCKLDTMIRNGLCKEIRTYSRIKGNSKGKQITYNEITYPSVSEMARRLNIPRKTAEKMVK